MHLLESGEMYLESILQLSQKQANVRSIDISEYMGYSKPSVSRAMGLLRNGGYIQVDKDGFITLTDSGREIAQKLYMVLEEILKRQGYVVLYALITAENEPSVRFHEKMGYVIKGDFPGCGFKHGRWLGLYWMEKRLKIVESPSAFPCSWLSIVQDAERFRNILGSLSLS